MRRERTIFTQPAIEKLQASLKNSISKKQRQAAEAAPEKKPRRRTRKAAEVA